MFNVHVYKYITETINSRSQSLFLQCSVKVGICTDSDLFLTLFKYTIVDPKAYDFPLNYILIITISFLLSHLSKKLCEDTQGYVCVCILGYISSDLIENRTARPLPSLFLATFFLRPFVCSAPVTTAGLAALFTAAITTIP